MAVKVKPEFGKRVGSLRLSLLHLFVYGAFKFRKQGLAEDGSAHLF